MIYLSISHNAVQSNFPTRKKEEEIGRQSTYAIARLTNAANSSALLPAIMVK